VARHGKSRIWSGFVLIGFHPFEADFEGKMIKAIGDLADNISIMTEAAPFGANLLGLVNLVDSRFVVNPKENFAGGRLKVEKRSKNEKEIPRQWRHQIARHGWS
jgi:hypothetical protein